MIRISSLIVYCSNTLKPRLHGPIMYHFFRLSASIFASYVWNFNTHNSGFTGARISRFILFNVLHVVSHVKKHNYVPTMVLFVTIIDLRSLSIVIKSAFPAGGHQGTIAKLRQRKFVQGPHVKVFVNINVGYSHIF